MRQRLREISAKLRELNSRDERMQIPRVGEVLASSLGGMYSRLPTPRVLALRYAYAMSVLVTEHVTDLGRSGYSSRLNLCIDESVL